jgi:hypothetical protein
MPFAQVAQLAFATEHLATGGQLFPVGFAVVAPEHCGNTIDCSRACALLAEDVELVDRRILTRIATRLRTPLVNFLARNLLIIDSRGT